MQAQGVSDSIRFYDGLEATHIVGDRCYLLAEYGGGPDGVWGSRLISGRLERARHLIRFEVLASTAIEGPQTRRNFTHEALVRHGPELWVLCELNGAAITDSPYLGRYSLDLRPIGTWPMPGLEYRITDATSVDTADRFWVLNLFWPPDAEVVGEQPGAPAVERLVPLRFTGSAIERDHSQPVLDLRGKLDAAMHNWEGVARWGEEGFLLVSDSYPEDILAYVARPE